MTKALTTGAQYANDPDVSDEAKRLAQEMLDQMDRQAVGWVRGLR